MVRSTRSSSTNAAAKQPLQDDHKSTGGIEKKEGSGGKKRRGSSPASPRKTKRKTSKTDENAASSSASAELPSKSDTIDAKPPPPIPIKTFSDPVIRNMLSFLPIGDVLGRFALVSHDLHKKAHSSVTSLVLSGGMPDMNVTTIAETMPSFVALESLHCQDLESLNDTTLAVLISKLSPSVKRLQITGGGLKSAKFESPFLRHILVEQCELLSIEFMCPELTSLELYDCHLLSTPKLQCPNLEALTLLRCDDITDKRVSLILKQLTTNNPRWSTTDSQLEPDNQMLLVDGQGQSHHHHEQQQQQQQPQEVGPHHVVRLQQLTFNQCKSLQNPVIEVDSLRILRIINCGALSNVFIKCKELRHLQLNWCHNLQNLALEADELETIELTQAGLNRAMGSNQIFSSVREQIIHTLQAHFGDQLRIVC